MQRNGKGIIQPVPNEYGYAVVRSDGSFMTPDIFGSADAARDYVDSVVDGDEDLSGFSLVEARLLLTSITPGHRYKMFGPDAVEPNPNELDAIQRYDARYIKRHGMRRSSRDYAAMAHCRFGT